MSLREEIASAHAKNSDLLKGGKSDRVPPATFPKKKVEEGAKVEREHTVNKDLAKEIARDHLVEDPAYYKKLRKMEKTAVSQVAFLDELEKISLQLNPAKWEVRKGLEGMGKNMAGAAGTFANPKKSLGEGWKATWTPGGKPLHPAYKALMGLQVAGGLYDVAQKNDATGRGRSRLRRLTGFLGDTAGGVMAAPFGVTGGIVGSMVGRKIGDTAGAAVDKLRGYRPPVRIAHNPSLPPRPVGLQD